MEGKSTAVDGRRSARSAVASARVCLGQIDIGELTDAERLQLVAELERLKGAAVAAQARAVDAVRRSRESSCPRDALRSVGSEVALARRESPALGDRFVGLAQAVVHELPGALAALEGGALGERGVVEVVRETATLTREDRLEVDARLRGLYERLGWRSLGRAARRVAAELDAASVVRRMERAVAARRVGVRPAPDGMAYLSVLGPLREVVGAYAALQSRAAAVVGGGCPDEGPEGRGRGAVAADTALRLLSGRSPGQVQPVEVHLVMTDRSLLGTGGPGGSSMTPARVPGHGSVPAPLARAWVRGAGPASVWVRRLYTTPDGRDLVAMDSRRRIFGGLLRRMLVLRDDVCSTPWCDAPIVHADHVRPAREGGPTSLVNGAGRCARCNQVKEAPGWAARVARASPRVLELATPTGMRLSSRPPPVLGWGSDPPASGPSVGGSGPGQASRGRPPSRGRW
ncbi:DUF222 domain-containing protein [Phycicoccus endophyticus]|uniref:DUF222 domain-containing protein n=1 Tax=Phycicoccus endophyticus TaxID=1690220 RepID=A0A7G9R0A1_9MICO|nr:DUF222 domain-containing protein [Phycicoccus endophyticus]NHI20170.1 DUF222 domain-containing protein [Phycicoccus endophyticus]QNN49026.1 DUF222 domain-containing protein [Phycicoccus endophyticus]GGL44726.1 HNH endonuclease [Phycicoccus endophyticus]